MKIVLSILAVLSLSSIAVAQEMTTIAVPAEGLVPGGEEFTSFDVETSMAESWKNPKDFSQLSDLEKKWWIGPSYFFFWHGKAIFIVPHGVGGGIKNDPVIEVYSEIDGPNAGSPNFACPSQREKKQYIGLPTTGDNTQLEGRIETDKLTDIPKWMDVHYKHTWDFSPTIKLTVLAFKLKPNIVNFEDVYSQEPAVTSEKYYKESPFASFCFRTILRNGNALLPYTKPVVIAKDNSGRYLQDTAEDAADTTEGDNVALSGYKPPSNPAEDNEDITYCETGIDIFFDLKAKFWITGFKTQALDPMDLTGRLNFKVHAFIGYCYKDDEKALDEAILASEALPTLEEAMKMDGEEVEPAGEDDQSQGGVRRQMQEDVEAASFSKSRFKLFKQKEEVPICICSSKKNRGLAKIDHITSLSFTGHRGYRMFATQTVIVDGQLVENVVEVDCATHKRCCEVKTILNEDFFQGNNKKATLYGKAHGAVLMEVGTSGYLGAAEPDSRRLVERKLEEEEVEFDAVMELEPETSGGMMIGGSAVGAIVGMVVAGLFM